MVAPVRADFVHIAQFKFGVNIIGSIILLQSCCLCLARAAIFLSIYKANFASMFTSRRTHGEPLVRVVRVTHCRFQEVRDTFLRAMNDSLLTDYLGARGWMLRVHPRIQFPTNILDHFK